MLQSGIQQLSETISSWQGCYYEVFVINILSGLFLTYSEHLSYIDMLIFQHDLQ